MFSTDFIFRQKENLVDNQKCQAGFRPLCNKILFQSFFFEFDDIFVMQYVGHYFILIEIDYLYSCENNDC